MCIRDRADIAYEDLKDPYGIQFWPDFKGRDGCRTPMVWTKNGTHGGFTEGTPWLPVPKDHLGCAVDMQEGIEGSLLEHYKAFLKFRKKNEALIKGNITFIDAPDNVMMFQRSHSGESLLVTINMSDKPVEVAMPSKLSMLDGGMFGAELNDSKIVLDSYGAAVAKIDASSTD